MKGWQIAFLAAALVLSSAGCAASTPATKPTFDGASELGEAAPAPAGLPEYAYRSSQAVKGYGIALQEKDLLAKLPCYCGCGQDAEQYENLKDCFFSKDDEFRDHAANCQICLEEALDAGKWKSQGFSLKEIREKIDEEYEGRGTPTDTPPVG